MSWSDAFLTTVLEEHCREQSPPDLTERILQRAGAPTDQLHMLPNPAKKRRSQLAAAAMVAIATAAVLGVWHASSTQEAQDPEQWLPLQRGTSWDYQVTDETGTWSYTETVLGSMPQGSREYHLMITHRSDLQQSLASRLVAIDDKGIWQDRFWSEQFLTFHTSPIGNCEMPLPAEAGSNWSWTREDGGRNIDFYGEVIDTNESCTVPAGTYATVHVRGESTIDGVTTVEDKWLARGIGLVRKVTKRDDQIDSDAQLTRQQPGTRAWEPQAVLPALLAKSAMHDRGMPDEVHEVALGIAALAIDSAFLRVRYGSDWQVWRVTVDGLLPFDASSIEAWNTLVAEERLFAPPELDSNLIAIILCGVAGRLEAADRGCTVDDAPFREQWTSADGQPTVKLDARIPMKRNGATELVPIHIDIKRGRIQSFGFR